MKLSKLAAAARLAQKYEFPDIFTQATQCLLTLFPEKFEDWVAKESERASQLLPSDAIEAIVLFRSLSLDAMLPSAFYLASQVPTSTILNGTKRADGVPVQLYQQDIARCLGLKSECMRASATAYEAVFGVNTGKACKRWFGSCEKALKAASARYRLAALHGDPLGRALRELVERAGEDRSAGICDGCWARCIEIEWEERAKIWSRCESRKTVCNVDRKTSVRRARIRVQD